MSSNASTNASTATTTDQSASSSSSITNEGIASSNNLLEQAQSAITRKDYNLAVKNFTRLIELVPRPGNLALALISRSLCYWELNDYEKALDDAMKAHEDYDDVVMPMEIINGAYNTKAASAFQIARCHTKLSKDPKLVSKYQKIGTDLLKVAIANQEKALELKNQGNDYFKRNWLEIALGKYEEALKLDPTNTTIMSNICQTLLKMNRLDEATDIAERCVKMKPDWAKGWYRKGMVAMKRRYYAHATSAFQSALNCSNVTNDELSELKSAYMQAVTLAEKTHKVKGGLDKQYMGMMMQMRAASWNVYQWYAKNRTDAKIWMLKDWNKHIAPKLTNDKELADLCDRALATKFLDMKKGSLPMDVCKWKGGLAPPRTSMNAYLIPVTPLVSLVIMHYILSKAYPSEKWSMVWTFQADPSLFAGSILSPHISQHRTYACLICKESNIIVDILSIWAYYEAHKQNEKIWFDDVVQSGLLIAAVDNDDPKLRNQSWTMYTCDDRLSFLEFIEAASKVERAAMEFAKMEEAEQKKNLEDKKMRLEEEREKRRIVEKQKMVEEARLARLARGESLPSEINNKANLIHGDQEEEASFEAPFDVSQPPNMIQSFNNIYYLIAVAALSIIVGIIAIFML